MPRLSGETADSYTPCVTTMVSVGSHANCVFCVMLTEPRAVSKQFA